MKLSEKLARIEPPAPPAVKRGRDKPVNAMRRRVREQVLRDVAPSLAGGSQERIRADVTTALEEALGTERNATIDDAARRTLIESVTADLFGYGPLDQFLSDPAINEIMCNAHDEIWIERDGEIERSGASFSDTEHYRAVIDKIVAGVGRRIDESQPYVDARLSDGSRVNAIIPPLSTGEPILTVRRFRAEGFGVKDLINNGTTSMEAGLFLEACVRGKQNVLITGGTGSGKTTLLNVLSGWVGAAERIITIEDAAELRLQQPHVVSLESRPANVEGRGEVTIRDLVRNALRMRPDRIIVGEVRGGEALDMLQAMNTGHEGSLTTVHANAPRDALFRLETMVLMAGFDLPMRAIREQIAAAIDVVVHQERTRTGRRRITEICEVHGMEGETIVLQTLFAYDHANDKLRPAGLRPKLLDRLADRGVALPPPWEREDAPMSRPMSRPMPRQGTAKRGRR
ncbi:MAG TPA: CpaF family protein [Actinomycetota bacterium]